jgi:hypothetical protein
MKVACSRVFSEGEFCAACHYGKFFDTVIYNSYGEWLQSDYSKKVISPDGVTQQPNPKYRSCQDCHMLSQTEAANTSSEQRACRSPDEVQQGQPHSHRAPDARRCRLSGGQERI